MSTTDNLKSFISKLNDRNLQRKRESGITSYALYAVLIYCMYKLYKNLSFYLLTINDFNLTTSIHLTSLITNSLLASYFILGMFHQEKKPFSNLKVIRYDNGKINLLEYISTFLIFAIPSVFQILSYIHRDNTIPREYYTSLGVLNLMSIVFLVYIIIRPKKEINVYYRKKYEEQISLRIFILAVSVSVIYFSLLYVKELILFEKIIFIKILILIYVILFLLEKIAAQEERDINTFNLEDFEYEIYLKKLNDEEIRVRLQENYVGYLIDYWVDYKKAELKLFKDNLETLTIKEQKELLELEKVVDKKTYPIEYEARKSAIIIIRNKEVEKNLPKLKKLLLDIKKIIKSNSGLTDEEYIQLNILMNDLDITISKLA